MQICDACSTSKSDHSPFAMVSHILSQEDEELADQTVCCLFMLLRQLLSLYGVEKEVLVRVR